MATFDPNRQDFAPYGLTCVRWDPSQMPRPDHHNEIELNLLQRGWVTYLLGGRKVRIEPERLSIFWAAVPHQIIDYGEGTEYFVVTIPFAWFLQFKMPDRMLQPLLAGVMLSETRTKPSKRDLELLAQWESDLRQPHDDTERITMLEIEARLLRLALNLPEDQPATKKNRGPHPTLHDGSLNKVEQMACLVAQRYTEPLTVEDIAQAVNLHPNYAMSLFKKAFGTTLIDFLTHHRVSHAQRLLAATELKIVDVAFDSGFNSISRFNDAFRRDCKMTPKDYRRMHSTSG